MSGYKIDRKIKYSVDDAITLAHDYGLDPKANHIYLFGHHESKDADDDGSQTDFIVANNFIKNLNVLMRRTDEPILVHMNLSGGHWTHGMAIYNSILSCPRPITILNYGEAESMSSLILLAANKRVMMPDSKMMIHEGSCGSSGSVKAQQRLAEQQKRDLARMFDIYVHNLKSQGTYSRWSKKRIYAELKKRMDDKEELWFSAREAVKIGFADEVFGEPDYNWETLTEYTDDQLKRTGV
jgi:ATP-dependent protease ClpP protease subunit